MSRRIRERELLSDSLKCREELEKENKRSRHMFDEKPTKKHVKQITVTVILEDWKWFKKNHICLSTFIQDKMHELIPFTEKNKVTRNE